VLGAVLTDAAFEATASPVDDGCGSCRRCLDSCPTEAIVAPGVVDARRCLAWLVQAEGMFPFEFRESLGDRIYGCDDCQDVCPPNLVRRRRPSDAGAGGAWADVLEMLEADDEKLLDGLGRWYIPRRDPDYLRRNALLVLGNVADPSDPRVVAAVDRHLASSSPMLRAHAVWTARRLGLEELLRAIVGDTDPTVQAELERPHVAAGAGSDEPDPAGAA
jgi:epoxyqueuosine reductase